jgi:hypothetical protein
MMWQGADARYARGARCSLLSRRPAILAAMPLFLSYRCAVCSLDWEVGQAAQHTSHQSAQSLGSAAAVPGRVGGRGQAVASFAGRARPGHPSFGEL